MELKIMILALILLPGLASLCLWLLEKYAGERVMSLAAVLFSAAELAVLGSLFPRVGETAAVGQLFSFGLSFQVSGFQLVLASLASFLWFMTTAFCPYYFKGHGGLGRYQLFSFITWGAIMGVFFSADFLTLLIFFEIMSVSSWVMVIHEQSPDAIDAAASYLGFAVIGGLCTMLGLFMLQKLAGTLAFAQLYETVPGLVHDKRLYVSGIFVLIGFAAKCGMWPLHTWLPAAHPAAPATASALLSGIITKAGVFGVCAVSVFIFMADYNWGMMLLCLGTVTMFTGAFVALFSIDLKRTLALSSMSQIGFILVGVAMQRLLGEHNTIAVSGSVLHVVNHSLLKLCLFLCAGVLVHCCHSRDLNELRGFGRGKKLFFLAFFCGYMGITCMPLFGGYISKTLLHESIVEYIHLLEHAGQPYGFFKAVEVLFLISGGFTVAYMTKLFVAIFVEKNEHQQKHDAQNGSYISRSAALVLAAAAIISPILGSLPHSTMDRIAAFALDFFHAHELDHRIHYFAFVNLKGAIISVVVGAVTYFGFIRTVLMKNGRYINVWPAWLDIERSVYRPLLLKLLPFVFGLAARLLGSIFDTVLSLGLALLRRGNGNIAKYDEDERFAVYPPETETERGPAATLSYGLALAGLAIVLAFAWVLLRL